MTYFALAYTAVLVYVVWELRQLGNEGKELSIYTAILGLIIGHGIFLR